jgi:hypothetical protein
VTASDVVSITNQQFPLLSKITSPPDKPVDSITSTISGLQQSVTVYFVSPAGVGVGVGVLVGVGVGDAAAGVLDGVGVGVGDAGQKVLSSHSSIEVLLIESTLFIDEHNTSFSLIIAPIL